MVMELLAFKMTPYKLTQLMTSVPFSPLVTYGMSTI